MIKRRMTSTFANDRLTAYGNQSIDDAAKLGQDASAATDRRQTGT
jgi:hypothetical protein